jgi:hypothetical protein
MSRCSICRLKKSRQFSQTYGPVCNECLDRMIRRASEIMKAKAQKDKQEVMV